MVRTRELMNGATSGNFWHAGGPDWDGFSQVAQQSFVKPVDAVFGFVRAIDGHYPGAEFIGVERPDSSVLPVKWAIGQLATEDSEIELASRYIADFFDTTGLAAASVRANVDRWIADGRIVVHNNPS